MKRTLTAPECLAYFFKTREKFNADAHRFMRCAINSYANFLGYRVSYCRYLLRILPERIAMTEFLLEHFDNIPGTEPIQRDYLECDHEHLIAYRDKALEYMKNPNVYS